MKDLTTSEKHTLGSLLWIVQADEEIFTKVMSLFRASRDDQQTSFEFVENMRNMLTKFGGK